MQTGADASRSRQPDELVTLAQQLLSETIHGLHSPLTAVRESVRVTDDGDLGQLSGDQRSALLGAIQGCSDMTALIDNMLRLESLRSGLPRVHRRWVDAATMMQSVAASVKAAGIDQNVHVIWNAPSSGHHLLYADPEKLQRLLLNLVCDAIRATPPGGQVMVQRQAVEAHGTLRFSVVDRGAGMSPSTMHRLAIHGSSACGKTGLGLAISRQMASLHFSNLEITSRPQGGTRVSFEVPSAGPVAVVDRWCRWRDLFRSSRRRPLRRGIHQAASEDRHIDDAQAQEPGFVDDTIMLTHEGPSPRHPDMLSVLTLQLTESTPVELTVRTDAQLQEGLGMYELAYRAGDRRWVVLWDADGKQAMERVAEIRRSIAESLPDVRMGWSNVTQLAVGARVTRVRLSDLFVRGTLGAGNETPIGDDRRMSIGLPATLSVQPEAAGQRLDAELKHLASRLKHQRTLMQQQAATIRPPTP